MKSNVVDFTGADRSERVIGRSFNSLLSEKERAAVKDIESLGMGAPQVVKARGRTPVTRQLVRLAI